ncbi:MAG: DUF2889 domain-containing protein [Syntrophomonadaceae bacterium]|nr:DUF2889 domain-containing protein [Syntrophomonadaceae bacterium]
MYEKLERYEVNMIPDKGYEVRGQWKDDIHDIRTSIVFDYQTYDVVEAEAELVSAPFDICQEGIKAIKELVGVKAGGGYMRTIREKIMCPTGCMHVGELAEYSITAALNCAAREMPDWVDEEDYNQRWNVWQHAYKDCCIYFSQEDALEKFQDDIQKVFNGKKEGE